MNTAMAGGNVWYVNPMPNLTPTKPVVGLTIPRDENGPSNSDLYVILTAVPTMLIFSLLFYMNFDANGWNDSNNNVILIGLLIAMSTIVLMVFMYILNRCGFCNCNCFWSGPAASDISVQINYNHSLMANQRKSDPPPCYDIAIGMDIPPPQYSAISFDASTDNKVVHVIHHI